VLDRHRGFTPLPQTWTLVLENQSGRQIVKCGVAGIGTKEELIKARKTINEIGHKPALVLVLYTTEWDLNNDTVFPSYTIVENEKVDSLIVASPNSVLPKGPSMFICSNCCAAAKRRETDSYCSK
jgi:hypothetical protein